ncbi:hypothetical protein M422DRAFT_261873 [Sphaerobolus stellatus SS14]|uniref:Catabolite repression protein creC n=1 Tax=Sphaerobolus stellatus (strain SS14) TaxID=990650 RepID=A0A0C9U1E2_SPHS4|nr:hypothetical protein M422DRAFT_61978 [Sphaerobolus stellatus SS14]KIJ35693.1 hypothetical protein M422DRAFT_261873 [Sphaerobolus stellatus SS14]
MQENDAAFVAPEGVYSLTDEQKPPAIHVPIGPIPPAHAAAHTRLSCITIKYPLHTSSGRGLGGQPFRGVLNRGGEGKNKKDKEGLGKDGAGDKESLSGSENSGGKEGRDNGNNNRADDPSPTDDPSSPLPIPFTPPPSALFTPVSPALSPNANANSNNIGGGGLGGAGGGKKKQAFSRPKHNMRTTSSTFVTKLQSVDGLSRIISGKQGEVTYLFYNYGKSFYWTEVKAKDPLARITFGAFPTCHDVNKTTASHERLDVIIGFNTGDLVWFDPISSRYVRINKQGSITSSPCTSVHWVPGSHSLFLVSFANGSIIIFDKERDDGSFTPGLRPPYEDWDWKEEMHVEMPPWHPASPARGKEGGKGAKDAKEKVGKNPISWWKVSERSVLDFVFSPDVRYVAAVGEDGCLRVIDTLSEMLQDTYASYFGSLSCVAWSPDGRFIITGGQDDLVTVISPWEQRIIARCQGHTSFVSAVAFDELRCDGRTYRFASVGEDNRLIFWDFSSGALHRPKLQAHYAQKPSLASTVSLVLRRRSETIDRSTIHLPGIDGKVVRYHPAPSRNDVAILQPVVVKHVDGDILSAIKFHTTAVFTTTRTGHLKVWVRPLATTTTSAERRKKGGRAAALDVDDL